MKGLGFRWKFLELFETLGFFRSGLEDQVSASLVW